MTWKMLFLHEINISIAFSKDSGALINQNNKRNLWREIIVNVMSRYLFIQICYYCCFNINNYLIYT